MPGTIEQRGPNSWRITVSNGYLNGKKQIIRESRTFPADWTEERQRRECEKLAASLYAAKEKGEATSSTNPTVSEFADLWLSEYPKIKKSLSPVTLQGYKRLLDGRIKAELGKIRIKKLTPRDLTLFYTKLLEEAPQGHRSKRETLSTSSVLHYHRCLRSMLTYAVKQGFLPYNPAMRASIPENDSQKGKACTPEQVKQILLALESEPLKYQAQVSVALLGQLRRGEIAGLNWSDVDFDRGTITVNRTAVYVSKTEGVVLKTPKTNSSVRTVAMPKETMALLKRLKLDQAKQKLKLSETWQDSGAVFCQWNGLRVHPDTLSKWFGDFLERHDLPKVRLHDMRHTGASILANAIGRPMQEVSERLGHASVLTTLSFYSHNVNDDDAENAEALADLVRPSAIK